MPGKIVKKRICAPCALNEPVEYGSSFSRGMRVEMGESSILFISGTASVDEKGRIYGGRDFSAQLRRTFDNISALIRSEGADWHDIVQTRCYLKNIKRDYARFNLFRSDFYKKQKLRVFPASVCVEANLCRPGLLFEMEAIAVLRRAPRHK